MSMPTDEAIKVFFSYAHEDEELRQKLVKHLTCLQRQGIISAWHDREISAGKEWANEIDVHLNTAQIILLLISADFLASTYCYDIELKRAMERHAAKEARVIPVILRPVDWKDAPFGELHALPENAKPVTNWPNTDEALTNVAKGIRKVVEELTVIRDKPNSAYLISRIPDMKLEQEKAICIKAEAEFNIEKRRIKYLPISDDKKARDRENINRELYQPFAVYGEAFNIGIETFILPLIEKRIQIELNLRTKLRVPFSQARISVIKQEIHDLILEELHYILNSCYVDATEHVIRRTGFLPKYKDLELQGLRDKYTNPVVLFNIVDDMLHNTLANLLSCR